MKKYKLILPVIVVLAACATKVTDDSPVVASVGKSVLTVNAIETVFLSETGLQISEAQIHRYVQRWIEKELVYREALETGLKENPEVKKHLLELEKDYLANKFVELFNGVNSEITEQEIRDYYEKFSNEFIRRDDFYNIRLILVENYRTASTLRQEVNAGKDFTTLAKNHSLHGSALNGGVLGWVTINQLDDDLAKHIPRLSAGQISTPIKTSAGYYLIQLIDKRPKDEVQTLEEVQKIIVERIRAEKKRTEYENLISELGEKYEINSNFEILKKYNK